MIKLRNRNTDPAPAPPFEGHGPDGAERATFAADASGVWRRPSARSTGCCRLLWATPAATSPTPATTSSRHRTGHAEAVEAWLDPAEVSYAELLQTFWESNPTTRNRQGFELGSQYRSAIFCHDAGQMEAAIASRDTEQPSLRRQIVTQITPASAFYRAEEYHQRYLEKHGHPSCAATIR